MSSTVIRDDQIRTVKVDAGGFIVRTYDERSIGVTLTDDQRKAMAAALDPDRATGGQWTRELEGELWAAVRDELRRVFPSPTDHDHRKLDVAASASVDAVREKLNVHHPKPVPYDQGGWPKSDAVGAAWKRLYEQAEAARDAAVARAENTARRARNANGRAELAEARVRELEKASAATKDGIEKAIKDQLAAEGWHATSVLIDAAVKGVCEYLYPAPAPHPVEALAEELFKVGHPEFALDWSNVLEHTRDVYRRMARHTIVERKADQ